MNGAKAPPDKEPDAPGQASKGSFPVSSAHSCAMIFLIPIVAFLFGEIVIQLSDWFGR
jgi:hypothetical protein